ncbi:slowpoke-binding protein-like [Planoprotostelium fungivorum]|uniref:Slowpoke-binding protein-like n=1 Tax=Planoprotostelium fungivorum TaxID=1890364 RepID=A0A2P6MX85_9EUKA|nr:slowpoke-binding protein-like [Planoprotostelium fungivorum]
MRCYKGDISPGYILLGVEASPAQKIEPFFWLGRHSLINNPQHSFMGVELVLIATVATVSCLVLFIALCVGSSRSKEDSLPLTRHDELSTRSIKTTQRTKTQTLPSVSRDVKDLIGRDEITMIARQYLRSTEYGNSTYLENIGSRKNKYYFMVQDLQKQKHLLTVISVGEKAAQLLLSDPRKNNVRQIVQEASNPWLYSTSFNEYHREKGTSEKYLWLTRTGLYCVVRPFNEKGSLRDYIFNSNPTKAANQKHVIRNARFITDEKISLFGRQILEGLIYLKGQNIPMYNVHAGNIIVTNNYTIARITDYESDILDLQPRFQKMMKGKMPTNIEPSVVGFLGILYELDSYQLDDLPNEDFSPAVKKVLREVLKKSGDTKITLEDLADLPLFKNVQLYSDWDGTVVPHTQEMKRTLEAIQVNSDERLGLKIKSPKTTRVPTAAPKTTSEGTAPAPAPAPAPPAPAPPAPAPPSAPPPSAPPPSAPPPSAPPPASSDRSSLLQSISSFNSKGLKKTKTSDRSGPRV